MPPPVTIITDPLFLLHEHHPGHPERPDRLSAALRAVAEVTALHPASILTRQARPVDDALVLALHDPVYIARLKSLRGQSSQLDPDTSVNPHSIDAAWLAAGAACAAVDAVIDGPARRAWALVRPPGHHAEADHAMGFCYLGNIALAAEHARRRGLNRVLIADFDVHHGNGTQHLLERRDDILVFNTHQWPLFPGTGLAREIGSGRGRGYSVNCPLPPGANDADLLAVYHDLLIPIADQFEPDLVLVSAGFDAHAADPLAAFDLSAAGFAHLVRVLTTIADRHAQSRCALVLEGGYDLPALYECVHASLLTLLGESPPSLTAQRSSFTLPAIASTRRHLAHHWRF